VLDDGGAVDLQEEVLVGLPLLPELVGLRFELRPGADRDRDGAVRPGISQGPRKLGAGKRHPVEAHGGVRDLQRLESARVDPWLPVARIPVAGPLDQFSGPVPDDPVTRVAQQPLVLGRRHVDLGIRIDELDHRATRSDECTGLN
jgi:hypothetical protein